MSSFPAVGEEFGPFVITGEVGRGGMGVVFAAYQKPLNRPVALKVLDPKFSKDPSFVARFTREAELLAKVNSPHVIQVYASGQEGDCLYLAMQPIMGGDLAEYVHKNGPLAPHLAADLTEQVATALADAHAVGIVHRDIKPSNVLLSSSAGDLFAYLCDFGIAQGEQPGETQTGMLVGSLLYTAPERHLGHPADVRSDLYSLGCLFWALISGTTPYSGTGFQIAQQHLSAPIPQLVGSGPIEVAINQILSSLLAKDPDERPDSAQDAVTALRGLRRLAETHPSPSWDPTVIVPYQPTSTTAMADTVLSTGASLPQMGVPRSVAPPVASQISQPPTKSGGSKKAPVVAALMVVAALIGGGGVWAISASSSKSGTPASSVPMANETSKAEPSEIREPTPTIEPEPVETADQELSETRHIEEPSESGPVLLPRKQALANLNATRKETLRGLELDGRWVLQVDGKYEGVVDARQTTTSGSHTFMLPDIWYRHESLASELADEGEILLLHATDFGRQADLPVVRWATLVDPVHSPITNYDEGVERCSALYPHLSGDGLRNSCNPRKLEPPFKG